MKKIKIYRDSWYRGKGGNQSRLLLEHDNVQCCLGQLASQCGIASEQLRNIPYVRDLVLNLDISTVPVQLQPLVEIQKHATGKYVLNSVIGRKIASVNDSAIPATVAFMYDVYHCDLTSEAQREQELTKLFKKYLDVEVEFVDGVAPWFKENSNGETQSTSQN